jgi:HEAT repeat protein
LRYVGAKNWWAFEIVYSVTKKVHMHSKRNTFFFLVAFLGATSALLGAEPVDNGKRLASLLKSDFKARAAEELALLGQLPREAIPTLIDTVRTLPADWQSKRHLDALRAGGQEVVDEIIPILASENTSPADFVKFATLLAAMGPPGAKGMAVLKEKLQVSDVRVMASARLALANLGERSPENLREIRRLARNLDAWDYIVLTLKELVLTENWIPDDVLLPALSELRQYPARKKLARTSPELSKEMARYRARGARFGSYLMVLFAGERKKDLAILRGIEEDCLKDGSSSALSYALVMARNDRKQGEEALRAALKGPLNLDDKETLPFLFEQCYRLVDAETSVFLAKMVKDEAGEVSQNVSLVLKQSGLSGRKAQPILLECLGKSGLAIQRGRAAFALGGVGEASVVPRLKELLTKEPSREVRDILTESIRAIQMEGD